MSRTPIVDTQINPAVFQDYKICCDKCCGLCCTALYFSKMDGFPEDKPAGRPCKNLEKDFRCAIHGKLAQKKMKGCLSYDCFGAGEHVTQRLFHGQGFPDLPAAARETMFQAFLIVCQLHQILWYLTQAATLLPARSLHKQARTLISQGRDLAELPLEKLLVLDLDPFRSQANTVLKEAQTQCAKAAGAKSGTAPARKHSFDYMGKNLKNKNLAGNDFSTACLIAANLDGADLHGASFLGADMRDTVIKNVDLTQSLFLTQGQINSCIGNGKTKLPPYFVRPEYWEQ